MSFDLIIQCGANKQPTSCRVDEMYMKGFWADYRRNQPNVPHRVFVLSAKYGLLSGDQIIAPYDLKMTEKKRPNSREMHYSRLIPKVKEQRGLLDIKNAYFIGGSTYYKVLKAAGLPVHKIEKRGVKVQGIGYMRSAFIEFLKVLK
jgi:hypothetical protein